jgi:hypothetical protein
MKKTILGLGILALMASCGGSSAEDVNVADVKDACSCSSGFITVANDILATIGDKTENELEGDEELMKVMKPKMDKLDELENKCRRELKVDKDEMLACDPELEKVMKKFEEKF